MSLPSVTPKALQSGDLIALISPSARLNDILPVAIDRSVSFLESQGFKVKVIFSQPASSSIKDEVKLKVAEVHEAFSDKEVKAIFTTIGGSHVNEILPHLDYELIKANPKIFMGYSDITQFHYALYTKTGLRTFYGPGALSEMGEYPAPLPFTVSHMMDVLVKSKGKPPGLVPESDVFTQEMIDVPSGWIDQVRKLEPAPGWRWLKQGTATGRIYGGCIKVLNYIAGTEYDLPSGDWDGRILFVEAAFSESGDGHYPIEWHRIDFQNFFNRGMFGKGGKGGISGLVIGRSWAFDDKLRGEFCTMLVDLLDTNGWDGPVLFDVDIGHTQPMLTIPLDAMVRLDSAKGELEILEATVC